MSNQSILPLIQARRKHSEDKHKPFLNQTARRYDWFRGIMRQDWAAQGRNLVHVPFALSVIMRDVAAKAQICLGANPPIEFIGPDSAVARKNTALVSQQFEDNHAYQKFVDLSLQADIYGTGFVRYGWKKLVRKGKKRVPTLPSFFGMFGPSKYKIEDHDYTIYDGPNFDVVDILDSFPQPGISKPWDARWWCFDYVMDLQDVELMVAAGEFDADGLALLRSAGNAPGATLDAKAIRYNVYRSEQNEAVRKQEKYGAPVYLTDHIGWVPNEFSGGTGIFKIVTMANNSVILRCKDFSLGEVIPVLSFSPMPDPHFIHGIGKIEAVEKLLALTNKTASSKADSMDFALNPPTFVNSLLGLDDENLNLRAGRIIQVDGAVDESQIRQFQFDTQGFRMAHEEIQSYWNNIQLATGSIGDVVMGMGSISRESATGFSGRQEGAMARQILEVKLAEKGIIEPLANAFALLNQLNLSMPRMVRMIGLDAVVDPITGLPSHESELQAMGFEDLDPRYAARAIGASQMLSQAGKQDNLIKLLTTLQGNPIAMSTIAWANMLKYTFRVFNFPNVNDFIVKAIPAVNQMASDAGVNPATIGMALGNAGGGMMNGGASAGF